MELEPVEIRNDKKSTAFLKRGEYVVNEEFLLNLVKPFFRIESVL